MRTDARCRTRMGDWKNMIRKNADEIFALDRPCAHFGTRIRNRIRNLSLQPPQATYIEEIYKQITMNYEPGLAQ